MKGNRSGNRRVREGEIPSPPSTTSISSYEYADLCLLRFFQETKEEMTNAGDTANPNAFAVQNPRYKHNGGHAWEKSTYPYLVEGTSNCVNHEPAAVGYWNVHKDGNPNPYVLGRRPDVGHSYAPECCGRLRRNIESMNGQRNAAPQNHNHCFDNGHELRCQMCACNEKKRATHVEAAPSYYLPMPEHPLEYHPNQDGDSLNNRNLMQATLPTQHALISSNSITPMQPFQSSSVANNTEQASSPLSVMENLIRSMTSSNLTSNPMNSTFDFADVRNGNRHSALDVEPLQMCMQSNCNDRQIILHNTIMLPSEEADMPKDSKQANPGKKRTNSPENEVQKHCSCKKSRCLQLYCECFAAEQVCNEACKCNGCSNKASNEEMIRATKQRIRNRNPHAFSPKFVHGNGETAEIDKERASISSAWHKRGCNCMKSKCQKRYCECYQAGVGCSSECRCEKCENTYGNKVYRHITSTVVEQGRRKEVVLYREAPAQAPVNGSQTNIDLNCAQRFNHEIATQNPFQGSYGMNVVGAHLLASHSPRSDSNATAVSYNQQLLCTSASMTLTMPSSCHGSPMTTVSSLRDEMFVAESAGGQHANMEENPETSNNAHPQKCNEVLATDWDNLKEESNGEHSKERQ